MYAAEDLLRQVAYIAAVFHWSFDSILDLEHQDRLAFIEHARSLGGDVL